MVGAGIWRRGPASRPWTMTPRNQERTGQRKLSRLSGIVRSIPGCRNIDLDMTCYCPKCVRFTAFIEIKTSLVPRDHWLMTRQLARLDHCFGVLVVEHPELTDLYPWHPDLLYLKPQRGLNDDEVLDFLISIHQEHLC